MAAAGEAAVIMAVGAAAVGVTVEAGEVAGAAAGDGAVAVGAVEDGAAMEATRLRRLRRRLRGLLALVWTVGLGLLRISQMSLRPLVPNDEGRSVL